MRVGLIRVGRLRGIRGGKGKGARDILVLCKQDHEFTML